MPKIRILPDHVANQIAAGEVVERPVAVVKELVENSLDAGATRVEVEFRAGGKSYMRVEDNGRGMSADDALLALERHATSKLAEADDLLRVTSFGFRGEALPSISSISRFTLRTRTGDAPHGTEVLVNAGKILHSREFGMPQGTVIEVAQLFNSVPARRKFLKTDNTEAAHITHILRLFAVAHPEVAFTVLEDGRTLFRTPPCPDLPSRVGEVFSRQVADNLIDIEAGADGLKLYGLIGKPGLGRSSRHDMACYVNRRPVDSRLMNYALTEAYHPYLPKGRYPLAYLFLDIDPAAVDVNVHPAKREIRFREQAKVRHFIVQSLLDRLRDAARGQNAAGANGAGATPPADRPPTGTTAPATTPRTTPGKPHDTVAQNVTPPTRAAATPHTDRPGTRGQADLPAPTPPSHPVERGAPTPRPPKTAPRAGWRCLGLAKGDYAVFETGQGFVLLHRRAAQERILYEEVLDIAGAERIASQRILFPANIELPSLTAAALEEHLAFVRAYGFDIEPFGKDFFRLLALPSWLDPAQGAGFVQDVAERLREGSINPKKEQAAQDELAKLAARRAVRLEPAPPHNALEQLAARLLACENPLADTRGRPTYIEITAQELTRKFGR